LKYAILVITHACSRLQGMRDVGRLSMVFINIYEGNVAKVDTISFRICNLNIAYDFGLVHDKCYSVTIPFENIVSISVLDTLLWFD
jgi:hypothetical protein